MASERIGLSYGQGRDKLREGKIIDALLTGFDNKVRIALMRKYRDMRIKHGDYSFPILTTPRCLRLNGFVPDCDAVYLVHPHEIINFLKSIDNGVECQIVYKNDSTFALAVSRVSN